VPILGSESGGEKVNVFEGPGGEGFPVPNWVPTVNCNAENSFGLLRSIVTLLIDSVAAVKLVALNVALAVSLRGVFFKRTRR
jgi:hypothetical protein